MAAQKVEDGPSSQPSTKSRETAVAYGLRMLHVLNHMMGLYDFL